MVFALLFPFSSLHPSICFFSCLPFFYFLSPHLPSVIRFLVPFLSTSRFFFNKNMDRRLEREMSYSAFQKSKCNAPEKANITNSDIFIICTIETLIHYSKHFLYTEKMVRPKAQNGSSIVAAQHFFNFIHILFFCKNCILNSMYR